MLCETKIIDGEIKRFKKKYGSLKKYNKAVYQLGKYNRLPYQVKGFHVVCYLDGKPSPYLAEWATTDFQLSKDHYVKWINMTGLDFFGFGKIAQVSWFMSEWSLHLDLEGCLYDPDIDRGIMECLESGFFPELDIDGFEIKVKKPLESLFDSSVSAEPHQVV